MSAKLHEIFYQMSNKTLNGIAYQTFLKIYLEDLYVLTALISGKSVEEAFSIAEECIRERKERYKDV